MILTLSNMWFLKWVSLGMCKLKKLWISKVCEHTRRKQAESKFNVCVKICAAYKVVECRCAWAALYPFACV